MIQLVRSDPANPDFRALVHHLDAYLAEKDGSEHAFYAQFNAIDDIRCVVVAYEDGSAVGCGAIKAYAPGVMEVKRMYTAPASRGKGVARRVLAELEAWAAELGGEKCILETGKRQHEAVLFYPWCGYQVISNFGQYAGVENSICFEKRLAS